MLHSPSSVRRVSVAEILPQPKAKCSARKRRGKKTEVLTSAPNQKAVGGKTYKVKKQDKTRFVKEKQKKW